jgi:hypothetical protein
MVIIMAKSFFFAIIIYITLATFYNALKCTTSLLKLKIIPNVALENMSAEKKYLYEYILYSYYKHVKEK